SLASARVLPSGAKARLRTPLNSPSCLPLDTSHYVFSALFATRLRPTGRPHRLASRSVPRLDGRHLLFARRQRGRHVRPRQPVLPGGGPGAVRSLLHAARIWSAHFSQSVDPRPRVTPLGAGGGVADHSLIASVVY